MGPETASVPLHSAGKASVFCARNSEYVRRFVIDTAAGIAGVFLGAFMRRMAASLAKLPKRG
jgi:hypothetical protein